MKRVGIVVASALIALCVTATSAFGAEVLAPPYDTNSECLQCHELALGGPAISRTEFTETTVDYSRCKKCHWATVGFSYGFPHDKLLFAPDCSSCHNSPDATNIWAGQVSTPYGFFASAVSPAAPAVSVHSIHTTGSWPGTQFGSNYYCLSCHGAVGCDMCHVTQPSHSGHVASASPDPTYAGKTYSTSQGSAPSANTRYETNYIPSKVTCVASACHPIAALNAGAAVPTCLSCHSAKSDAHGYQTVTHSAVDSSTAGVACSACHSLELDPEHTKITSSSAASACGACHPTPRDSFASWDQTCVTGGCHVASSSAPMHAGATTGHSVVSAGQVCLECHDGSDLPEIHVGATSTAGASSCLVCHVGDVKPATNDCTVCHFRFTDHYGATRHVSPWNLSTCTGSGCHSGSVDLLTVHTEKNATFGCQDCHASTRTEVIAAIQGGNTACDACHTGASQTSGHRATHWAMPLLQGASGPNYSYYLGSQGAQPTGDCAGCHVSNLMDEHLGLVDAESGNAIRLPRKDASGAALICASCHASLDPQVLSAIALGRTACDDCHVVHGPVEQMHASTFGTEPAVDCAACHPTSLLTQHNGRSATMPNGVQLSGCDVCHAYTDGARGVQIQAAISATENIGCSACHAATHSDKGGHSATSSESLGCGSCHAEAQSVIDVRTVHAACATCHENPDPSRIGDISAKTAECGSCHSANGVDYHRGLPGKHNYSAMPATCQSPTCHPSTSLPEAHEPYLARYPEYATTCALCHANADSGRIPVNATAACESCHASIHPNMDHSADNSQACVSCHETGDVMTLHQTGGQTDCALCHGAAARVTPLPATVDCVNCHAGISPADPKHYTSAAHATSDGSEGGYACSACHGLDLKTEHAKASVSPAVTCVSCHETKVDGFAAPWNKTCATCHATRHSAMATKHTSAKTACAGTGCHVITDVAALHSATTAKCGTCHGASKTPSTDCATTGCHSTVTGNHEAQHDTAGVTDIGCKGCHFQFLTTEHSKLGYSCATCHDSTSTAVVAAIAGGNRGCDACHPAVNGKDYHKPQAELEFVPGNSAMHRVTSNLPGMRSSFKVGTTTYTWTLPTVSSFLKAGWATDSVVTCDKCHTYTGSTGPHGATMKVNIDPAYPGDYQTAYLGDSGSPGSVICAKCHTNFNGMNRVHSEGDHHGSSDGKCVNCHAGVPHGWRLPRMLAYTTDPAPYRTVANGLAAISLSNRSPSDWSESNCQAACGGGDHSSRPSSVWPSTVVTVGNLSGTITGTGGVQLAGVTVTTDKGQSGTTDAAGKYTFAGVATGTYVVTAAKTGFATQSKSVSVANGLTATVNFAMTAQAAATNLARTGTGSASSVYDSSNDASKAFDGSTTSYWRSSSNGTQWLKTDLGVAKSVSKVVVKWYDSTYYARSYRIETSTDGSAWTSRYSTTDASSGTKTHTFSAVSARYVRIYCTYANSSNYRIGEFEVWNY